MNLNLLAIAAPMAATPNGKAAVRCEQGGAPSD
jgi:hypothetical protein